MDIRALTRTLTAKICVALVGLLALPSCNDWLYEEEGDCSVHYRLKFRYDKNLKWADAFANEVSSVHLYAFDPSGVLAWRQEEQIDPSTADSYSTFRPATTACWLGAACATTASATSPSPFPKSA